MKRIPVPLRFLPTDKFDNHKTYMYDRRHMVPSSVPDKLYGHHFITDILPVLDTDLECIKTFKVLVATIDAQWEGMGDVGSAR